MKGIILEKYKLVNIFLLAAILLLLAFMHFSYESWFTKNDDIVYIYKYYDGIYSPIFAGGQWLAGILTALLLFPAQIFRRWLFYIAPFFLLLTLYLVQNISVYSNNLLNPTRGQMAENCMIVLAVITLIFALVQKFVYKK